MPTYRTLRQTALANPAKVSPEQQQRDEAGWLTDRDRHGGLALAARLEALGVRFQNQTRADGLKTLPKQKPPERGVTTSAGVADYG